MSMKLNYYLDSLQAIDLELPIIVKLTVVDTEPGIRGDTVQGNNLSILGRISIKYMIIPNPMCAFKVMGSSRGIGN